MSVVSPAPALPCPAAARGTPWHGALLHGAPLHGALLHGALLHGALLLCAVLLGAPGARAAPLAAEDPLGAVRAALAAGRFEDLRSLVQQARAAGVEAPGLQGAALVGRGDAAGACALYQRDRSSPRAPAAALRSARCLEAGDPAGALAAWLEVGAGPLGADALVVDELAAFLERRALPLPEALRVFDVQVGLFDDEAREALGRALLVVTRRDTPERAARALERLLVELSDTAAAAQAEALPAARARPPETLAAAVKRADMLAQRHESEAVVKLLERFALDDSATACEARLLLGKAQRKLRKYGAAQRHLDAVAKRCHDDSKRKAAYLAARVAAVSKNARAVELLEGFARDWPDDTLTDDVLLWLGELLERKGDEAGARSAFTELLKRFPEGDMAHEARFSLAMLRAAHGDADGARALLDEAARMATGPAGAASPYVADRALYWRARLQRSPRPESLEPTADAAARDAGLVALRALATSRPASYYGHLARMLVEQHGVTQSGGPGADDAPSAAAPSATAPSAAAPSAAVPGGLRALARSGTVTPSAALEAAPGFRLARALVEGGYDEEARRALGLLDLSRVPAEDRFAVALLVSRVGAPGDGHALLRNGGLALLPGSPGKDNALAWSLDWPLAHSSAIEPAADELGVPRPLLYGLAREESAFDAEVVSWAGAVGLCQLMPPTALDEARDLKLPPPTVADLTRAPLNARLGAAHLSRRLKGMGHPLLAIAAYNAGPGMVAQWVPARGQSMPLDWLVERIPVEETRNYVKKVTGSWVSYAALDQSVAAVRFDAVVKR